MHADASITNRSRVFRYKDYFENDERIPFQKKIFHVEVAPEQSDQRKQSFHSSTLHFSRSKIILPTVALEKI